MDINKTNLICIPIIIIYYNIILTKVNRWCKKRHKINNSTILSINSKIC